MNEQNTQLEIPSAGGVYERLPDGSLKRIEPAEAPAAETDSQPRSQDKPSRAPRVTNLD